jgi:hypothetical protein
MTIWSWLFGGDTTAKTFQSDTAPMAACNINPATGLPMLDSCGGLDVGGNPYGVDWSQQPSDTHATSDF